MGAKGDADLVLTSGAVYTVDATRSWARAVAVKGDRIVAVGTDDELGDLIGAGTDVIDLRGRMLLPGFQDAHVHPVAAGVDMLQCDLHLAGSLPEYERIVRTYAETHAGDPWIVGSGWSMDVFPGGTPTRDVLDRLVPDRPVFMPNRDGHSAWVNSRALELAGVTRVTSDPADGRIERDAAGEPTGTLHEGAMDLVGDLTPATTAQQMSAGLLEGQAHLHSLGITAWQDAIVEAGERANNFDAYVHAAAGGALTARVVGALWWDRGRGLEQIEDLVALRERGTAGRFRATTVKIMQDGVCENFTAAVLEPYLDANGHPTGNRGISFVEPDLLKEAVTRLDALGFQVHFHALAERAVREALDAIEAARTANGMNDLRHHLAHIQVVHPDDVPRFRRVGAVANAQPLWAAHEGQMDELTIPFLGHPRATWQYPFASLVRSGAHLAMGSDWSVSSPDPLQEMHVAVNRVMPPDYPYSVDNREVFIPEERIDLATAIAGFTMGSAYVNHLEHETGSIEVGKLADLTVVDRDLFDRPPGEIADASVQLTVVGGRRVYEDPAFA
ncbi:MAG: amidohydrolase [Actinomycetota bacterium]|nr:amidohydrolase [Actinomycetota bacterium]